MATTIFQAALLALFSIFSGAIGVGIGYAALPILILFGSQSLHEVQPVGLLLNGLTAGLILVYTILVPLPATRTSIQPKILTRSLLVLIGISILGSSLGTWLSVQITDHCCVIYFFYIYTIPILFILPQRSLSRSSLPLQKIQLWLLAFLATSIAGFLGVGPGYLILPLLLLSNRDLPQLILLSTTIELSTFLPTLWIRRLHIPVPSLDLLILSLICVVFTLVGAHFLPPDLNEYKTFRWLGAIILAIISVFAFGKILTCCPIL